MEEVKRKINLAFLAPLRSPALREAYGKSLRGGLLLYGPPGCGKTFLARAVAGELGARFLVIGLQDVLDLWLGESERRLHDIFESARRHAPCVLFFDELDAMGQKRSQLRGSAGRNVINQLLSELDGFSPNQGVFVMGATNHPWDVDVALLRPGRFDRLALVLPPDTAAREVILAYHLRDRPLAQVDLRALARATEGLSGADLARLCEAAAELAIERALATDRVGPIDMDDLEQLAARIVMIDRGRIAYDGSFDRLRSEFSDRRRLLIETNGPAAPQLAAAEWVRSDECRHEYLFDARQASIATLLEQAGAQAQIVDVETHRAAIDEVIAHIYERWQAEHQQGA